MMKVYRKKIKIVKKFWEKGSLIHYPLNAGLAWELDFKGVGYV